MTSTKTSFLFPRKMIKMLKGQKKRIDKEQGKTKHEASCSVNFRATQNKLASLRSQGLGYPTSHEEDQKNETGA